VTADDLDEAVRLALDTLRDAPPQGWDQRAGPLEWPCWETVEPLADALSPPPAQLGLTLPPLDRYVPFALERRRPEGPNNTIHAKREAGPDGLLQVLEACGALLSAMVRTAPPDVRGHHGFGKGDAAAFAAMGIVETVVHVHDICEGLGLAWEPPAGLCSRVLARLFPDAPTDAEPWAALLWATGRGELPGRSRLTEWRWYNEPR